VISLHYDPSAEQVEYLETRRAGLGARFLAEVKDSEALIARFPLFSVEVEAGVRKRVLPTFSYSLLYSLEGDGALILAVAHHKREPGYWGERVSGG
jgi:toxin ParE1/3/4